MSNFMRAAFFVCLLAALAAPRAYAADVSPSNQAFEAANDKMHEGMSMDFTGNADVDFVTGMIPHHQGAIDMAAVELKYGKDPAIRKLAKGIIKAQKSEIAMMREWLSKHPSEAIPAK
jgi:hypothetical protein